MRIKGFVLILFFLFHMGIGYANEEHKDTNANNKLAQFSLEALASYSDFKFNSSSARNYNRFQGHSNLYLIGGHDGKIRKNLSGGVLFYNVNTRVISNVLLEPSSLVTTNQTILNNNIMAHLLQEVKPNWFIDLLGNYGQSQMSYMTTIGSGTGSAPIVSPAKSRSNNWYVNLTGEHVHPWRKFILKGFLSLLHTENNQGAYNYYFTPSEPNPVAPISNQATFVLENAEISYVDSPHIQPFINGGLLQVLQYNNSRPLVSGIVLVGTLPEFNINQNGFRVGAGVSLIYKQVVLRIEQQYDQRGTVYHSNQTIAALTLAMG